MRMFYIRDTFCVQTFISTERVSCARRRYLFLFSSNVNLQTTVDSLEDVVRFQDSLSASKS